MLNLSPLGRALASLDRAAIRAQASPDDEELRDAVIQRFEYTYELCWKMLKRHLEQVVADLAHIDGLSFRDLIREGTERGIIAEPEPWFEYRHQRSLTPHTYDNAAAQLVYQTAIGFRDAARALLVQLERRNVKMTTANRSVAENVHQPLILTPRQFAEVRELLQRHLPGVEVRAFGSRARGYAKPASDLDLMIVSQQPLDVRRHALLANAFSESDLPFEVDLVDATSLEPSFRARALAGSLIVQKGS